MTISTTTEGETMTIMEKAKAIRANGMQKSDVFGFFTSTNRDVAEYIALFGSLGVAQNDVWNVYEEWQTA